MSSNSSIEWTDHTFNPWWGCTKISDGCSRCYADTLSTRYGFNVWGPKADRRFFGDKHWAEPLKWNKAAEKSGERKRVFCASMADVFERHMLPNIQSQMILERSKLWDLIDRTPMLDWLLLTKRPENIREMVPVRWLHDVPQNVWYGTSVENQEYADKRIPELLKVPAAVRFLSCEPLLGAVDLSEWLDCPHIQWTGDEGPISQLGRFPHRWRCDDCGVVRMNDQRETTIDWVIAGGESGPGARPMHPDWARSLRDQCQAAGVAFHFKQWGEYAPYEIDAQPPFWRDAHGQLHDGHGLNIVNPETCETGRGWYDHEAFTDVVFRRVGKKNAGRLLDGVEWNQFPITEVTPCSASL